MSDNDSKSFNRRRLLKATGAALGATVIGAGNATADHIRIGDCATAVHDVQGYETCSLRNPVILDSSVKGAIVDRCDNSSYVHFLPEWRYDQDLCWVEDSYLEKC